MEVAYYQKFRNGTTFKGYLLPVNETLYDGKNITLTMDTDAHSSGLIAFWYEDGTNRCYLSSGVVKSDEKGEYTSYVVSGCEKIGWKEAKVRFRTMNGPKGIEYYIYDDFGVYQADKQKYYRKN